MDGLKKRLNGSVRYRLSFSLAVTVIAIALAAGVFSFVSAFKQAEELQDDVLIQIAALADQSAPRWTPAVGGTELKDSDNDSSVFIQALDAMASTEMHRAPAGKMPALSAALTDGLHTIDWEHGAFRVLVKTIHTGGKIAVLQETSARDETAYRSALDTLLPFLILVPVLLFIIAQLVRKMFRPITELSRQIDARVESNLFPVRDEHLPSEIRPFILAINRLLARVAEAVNVQRRFVADAAHELRSPLTALALQAERLEHLQMSDAARERLHILEDGIRRAGRLLNQLLNLSKAQTAAGQADEEVSIRDVYRLVLEDLLPLAKAKHIDLGVLNGPDIVVRAQELDLYTLIKNLVDNAIRYTPMGGRVDLSAETSPQGAIIRVADTGPGIPPEERERVFDPFHRILGTEQVGSGLGLAIVKAIAERHNASIRLDFTNPAAQTGLAIAITLPEPGQAVHGT